MIRTVTLDTNIILRYLLADHPVFFAKANQLFQIAQKGEIKLFIDEVVVAEIIWTLLSFHKVKKSDFCSRLSTLISLPIVSTRNKQALLRAINIYDHQNVDYIDAWIYSVSKARNYPVATFDADFKKLKASLYTW